MSDEDRARLLRLAQLQLRFCRLPGLDQSCESEARGALDAIALWSLLQEPTCLLCGVERKPGLYGPKECGECGSLEWDWVEGPDADSVLCSRCRSYPNQMRNYIDGTLETFSVWKCDPTGGRG